MSFRKKFLRKVFHISQMLNEECQQPTFHINVKYFIIANVRVFLLQLLREDQKCIL
jgi:hypothetical protein